MNTRKITLIEGDGIGPEISASVVAIFTALNIPVEWETAYAGLSTIEKTGDGVPEETLESIVKNTVALKGPTTTPVGRGHKSVNVTIRKRLELFANVRLARTLPAIVTPFPKMDVLVVRENVEDTYAGIEHWQTPNVAQCLKLITRQGCEAVIRYGFEAARVMGRQRVTCVHKANIHKITDGLFLDVFRMIGTEYGDIEQDEIIVDNCCMQLVTRPEQFDVLVLPNLYGDIISDLCAGLVGGLGVAPGGNIGSGIAVFEAVHGSAPDIAGRGVANPTALLLSAIHMLEHMGLVSYANVIYSALNRTLIDGIRTSDLGGNVSTSDFTRAVIDRLEPVAAEESTSVPILLDKSKFSFSRTQFALRGIDVFIEHSGDIPKVPAEIGKFQLTMISNRGTTVWPEHADVMLVDHFRCRYLAPAPVTRQELLALLQELTHAGLHWCHIENLNFIGETPCFSFDLGYVGNQ